MTKNFGNLESQGLQLCQTVLCCVFSTKIKGVKAKQKYIKYWPFSESRWPCKKNSTELVEGLKIYPNETRWPQGYGGSGVSFHICLNRKISSVEFFLSRLSGFLKCSIFYVFSFGFNSLKIGWKNTTEDSLRKLEALWFQNCQSFLSLTLKNLRNGEFTFFYQEM